MQEIKKRRIVIASVLKPVDDTRMYEKFGMTLALHHEVHIIGFHADTVPVQRNIEFHSLGYFSRLSFDRFSRRWKVFQLVRQLKPDVLILCTHELLWLNFLVRFSGKMRIWYDVQEDYYKNILYTNAFPRALRRMIASSVRMKEKMCARTIEIFLLAERVYEKDLTFARRSVVIENKCRKPAALSPRTSNPGRIRLLFTGTLAESTGVYRAVDVAIALHGVDPRIHLTIVGFCSKEDDYHKLKDVVIQHNFISLVGGNQLVPHRVILDQIRNCDFGIISYPANPATEGRVPTKLYEYLSYKLPILAITKEGWGTQIMEYEAGIQIDLSDFEPIITVNQMTNKAFYPTDIEGIYWESEEHKLLSLV